MREFMSQHIQALAELVGRTGKKQLPAVITPCIGGIVDRGMIFITEILQDHDRRSESVSAIPSDLIVIIPGTAVVVKSEQAVFIPAAVVRTCFHDNAALVVKEFVAVRHRDPPLDIAQVIHPGPAVAHQIDIDFLFASVCEHYSAAVFCRLHEFEHVGSIIAGFRSFIARHNSGQAVKVFTAGCHIVRKVRKIRTGLMVFPAVIAVYSPDKTALLFLLLRIGIQVFVHRKNDLRGHAFQNLRKHFPVLLCMFAYYLFRLLSADSLCRFNLRKLRFHAAGHSKHISIGIRDDLDCPAGNGRVRVHLEEYIVTVAGRVCDHAPGFELDPVISSQKTRQGGKHFFRVLHILHRS